ncbi:hypothetical protein BH20GEM2_BH20GEM2_03400 [soil metagenome]
MLQFTLPGADTGSQADTASLEVLVPSGFARWRDTYLGDNLEKVLVFLLVAAALYVLVRLARRQIGRQIEDVNRRHSLRKGVGYGYAALLVVFAVALFAESLTGLGTILAVLIAGIAVALQDILKSVVAWLYISSRSGVQVGTRIHVEGVTGDVIDVGLLKTTLLEVGNLVYGMQSTGRLVTVPNYMMLASVVHSSSGSFVWLELKYTVTYESDWERADEILREIAAEVHAENESEVELGFRRLERRYAFKYGALTPITYVTVADSGVDLVLRLLAPSRRRRGISNRINRRLLHAFAGEPNVELAYPTQRIFRLGEDAPEYVTAADPYGVVRAEPQPDALEMDPTEPEFAAAPDSDAAEDDG